MNGSHATKLLYPFMSQQVCKMEEEMAELVSEELDKSPDPVAQTQHEIPAMAPIIQAKNVHKVYVNGEVKVHALRGVDLNICKGEMVAIMGPSGCGKTTLLNVLSGLDDTTEGEVRLNDRSLGKMSDRKLTRFRAENMGFIFQAYNLLPVLNAVENVELPLLVTGVRPKIARQRAGEALAMVGLADQALKKPAQMSGGQQQRVTIARALVNNPAIVWGDELTGALDSETTEGIMDLVCQLNEETQQTIVIVTHGEHVAERAHKTIHMRDGLIETEKISLRGQQRINSRDVKSPLPEQQSPQNQPQGA